MKAWVWIEPSVMLAVHDAQIAEHGGASGIRDQGLFESVLAHPHNQIAYGEPDHAELAACYGIAITKNRPFVDGSERTAFIAAELFLGLNGWKLTASDADATLAMRAIAAGTIDAAAFANWIRGHASER